MAMQRYRNPSGTSGVLGYEIGEGFIRIEYLRGGIYFYGEEAIGKENLAQMKRLAIKGSYLNEFINKTPQIRKGGVKEGAAPVASKSGVPDSGNLALHFDQ